MPTAPRRWAASPARKARRTRQRRARRWWSVYTPVSRSSYDGVVPHHPASVSRSRPISASGVTSSARGGSSQSMRQVPSSSGRAVTSSPPVRHGGSRCSNASPGQGSSVRRATTAWRSTAVRPAKRTSRSLRTVERAPSQPTRWLPRHQVAPGPVVWAATPLSSCSRASRRLAGASWTSREAAAASRRPRVRACWGRWTGEGPPSRPSPKETCRCRVPRRMARQPVQRAPSSRTAAQPSRSVKAAVSGRRTAVRTGRGSSSPDPSSRTTEGTFWAARERASASPTGPAPTTITGSTAWLPGPGGTAGRWR